MMMWQLIETAPKDGSFILLATPKGRIADGFWSPVYGVWSWPYVMVEPTHWMPLLELPGAQTQPAPSVPDGWLRAIDEALVVVNIGVANESDTYEQAKAKLDSLIGFHVDVATDPAVNGGWKLVPRPPTPTMVKAGLESSHVLNVHRVLACYDAMINAAQCVPSVPECWLPVPEKHPTFDPVDLQLSDGSVLCGCVPQSDGDYWWEGPSGEEVFIDPKYASVTHWRLAAAPEAKP